MKPIFVLVALAMATPAAAQHAGHDQPARAAPAANAVKGAGVVKAVNAKAGTIKIHHGPIPALKWPAMTMDFKASPQVIAQAKTGKSVTFTLNATGAEVLAIQ